MTVVARKDYVVRKPAAQSLVFVDRTLAFAAAAAVVVVVIVAAAVAVAVTIAAAAAVEMDLHSETAVVGTQYFGMPEH